MSVDGWDGWSERGCRPARRTGGTPVQEPDGTPAKPRIPLTDPSPERRGTVRAGAGSPQVWRSSAQRVTARPEDDPGIPDTTLIQSELLHERCVERDLDVALERARDRAAFLGTGRRGREAGRVDAA